MRKKIYCCLIFSALLLTLLFPACKKNSDNNTNPDVYTETFFTNPGDNQIYEVDSAGRKAILMGPKDANGLPVNVTQALVDAPDMNPNHKLLMDFNEDGTVKQISNPAMGFMTFNYVNDTTIVIRMTLPDTLGSYQMTYNPNKTKSKGDCGCGKKKAPVTGPKRADVMTLSNPRGINVKPLPPFTPGQPKSTNVKANITATYDPGAAYVTGLAMSAQYVTDEGKSGAIQVENGSQDGVFTYSMPDNPAPPPPSGFSAKVYNIFNKLCYGSIPIGLGKEAICGALAPETAGIGFVVCEVALTTYIWLCRANTAVKIGSYVADIYSSSKVTITITAQHPTLAPQSKQVEFVPSTGTLPDVAFSYIGSAIFDNVYTAPDVPNALQGYTIVAILSQTGTGTVPVRLSMVGSDGYTKSEDFQVAPGGDCQLYIPGGAQGVRDDIRAQINPGSPPLPGQLVKLYVVFQ